MSAEQALTLSQAPGAILPTQQEIDGFAAASTAGISGVSADGAATYQIPLWTPPGRAGIEPSLTLQYDSHSGVGIAGLGWTLTGFSQIVRCGRSLAQDGWTSAPEFNNTPSGDRFCLDGQRLVAVRGEYGAESTWYHVEQNESEKIVSLEVGPSGPRVFKVFAKDGTVRTYGAAPGHESALFEGSRVSAGYNSVGTPVRDESEHVAYAWGLSRVEDTSGNYLTIGYSLTGDTFSGYEWLPKNIRYTGWTLGITPTREIVLEYKDDSRFGTQWVSGFHVRRSKLLTQINMIGPAPEARGLLRRYELSYREPAARESYTLLEQVRECDGMGVCKRPVTFTEYWGGQAGWTRLSSSVSSDSPIQDCQFGDLDGDGRDDWMYVGAGGAYYYRLSEGDKFGPPLQAVGLPPLSFLKSTTLSEAYHPTFMGAGSALVDVDGDGRAEFLGTHTTYASDISGKYNITSSANEFYGNKRGELPGSALFHPFYKDPSPRYPPEMADWRLVDLNGDGRLEYVGYDESSEQLQYSDNLGSQGFSNPYKLASWPKSKRPQHFQLATTARDGTTAIGYGRAFSLYNLGPAYRGYLGPVNPEDFLFFADANGDGLDDIVILTAPPSNSSILVDISINTGNGYEARKSAGSVPKLPDGIGINDVSLRDGLIDVYDWNSDGRDELYFTGNVSDAITFDNNGMAAEATFVSGMGSGADQRRVRIADVNGDGVADFTVCTTPVYSSQGPYNTQLTVDFYNKSPAPLLAGIETGDGRLDTFQYSHTGNKALYSPGGPYGAPLRGQHKGIWFVARASSHTRHSFIPPNDPRNAPQLVSDLTFKYGNSRSDTHGRGWLGFGLRTVHNELTNATTTTTTTSDTKIGGIYPLAGLPGLEETEVTTNGVRHISYRAWEYEVEPVGTQRTRLKSTKVRRTKCEEPAGRPLKCLWRQTATQTFGAFGNLTETSDTVEWEPSGTGYAMSSSTASAFHYEAPNTENWLVARLKQTEQTRTDDKGRSVLRTWRLTTNAQTGLVEKVETEPDSTNASVHLAAHYFYNAYGLPETLELRDSVGNVRRQVTAYDTVDFAFPVLTESGGVTSRFEYHRGLGLLMREEDANGSDVTFSYDGFGRLRLQDGPQSNDTSINYTRHASGEIIVTQATAGGQTLKTRYEALGTPSVQEWTRSDGTPVTVTMTHDSRGQWIRSSLPYAQGEAPRYTHTEFDTLGRRALQTLPDGNSRSWTYDGLTTVFVDEMKRQHKLTVNGRGLVTFSADTAADGRPLTTTFEHGPSGELLSVRDPKGNLTTHEYDILGRQTHVVDLNEGTTQATYNAFGEVLTVSDALGTTAYTRDSHGRPTEVETNDGTTTFEWDTSSHGIGKLASTTSADGITTTYTYDELGRSSTTTWQVDDSSYSIGSTYDDFGRLATVRYPRQPFARRALTVRYGYNAVGQPTALTDTWTNTTLWRAHAENSFGQLVREEWGNGVTSEHVYDDMGRLRFQETIAQKFVPAPVPVQRVAFTYAPNGSLIERHDLLDKDSEDFGYDHLDRLNTWRATQDGQVSAETFNYDDIGNLLSRRVIAGPGQSATFGYTGVRPHAVATRTQGGQAYEYSYDLVGNRTSDGTGRTVGYTSFDLPKQTLNNGAATTYRYDALHQRVVKELPSGDKTITLGNLFELRSEGSSRQYVHNLWVAGRHVAQVLWDGRSIRLDERVRYLHGDQQGALTALTDETGQLLEKLKLDPFGMRRSPNDLAQPFEESPLLRRTFQGHSLDAESGLVNMNGRMYDAHLGAFLSPDPFVTAPLNGQSYNRYRFGFNNPQKYTDPSGFTAELHQYYDAGGLDFVLPTIFMLAFGGGEPSNRGRYGTIAQPRERNKPKLDDPNLNSRPIGPLLKNIITLKSGYQGTGGGVVNLAPTINQSQMADGTRSSFASEAAMGVGLALAQMGIAMMTDMAQGALGGVTGRMEAAVGPALEGAVQGYQDGGLLFAWTGAVNAHNPLYGLMTTSYMTQTSMEQGNGRVAGYYGTLAGVTALSILSMARVRMPVKAANGVPTTRVGRWMSEAEHGAMQSTGKVQESLSGTTHVAHPAAPEAFMSQARPGSVYVEFDVPASAIRPTQAGWAKIVGPQSLEGRLAAKKGLPVPEMPPATNLEHAATKFR